MTIDPPSVTDVVVPIWGDDFWSLFAEFTARSYLTPANLDGLKRLNARWLLFCHPREFERYCDRPALRELLSHFDHQVVDLADLERKEESFQYPLMTRCHQRTIDEARGAIIFLNPDLVASANSFSSTADLAGAGIRAVLIQGIRLVREEFVSMAKFHVLTAEDFAPRRLMQLASRILHPLTMGHVVRNGSTRYFGSYYWPQSNGSILAHSFHLHPIFYWPKRAGARVVTTIDHELVRISVDDDNVQVIDDSDQVLQLELSPRAWLNDHIHDRRITPDQFNAWAVEWTSAQHRAFFRKPLWFKTGVPADRAGAEARARMVVDGHLRALEEAYGSALGIDMRAARRLYQSLGFYTD